VPKDPNHTLFFKSGENYEAFLDRVIEGHKQKKGFRRFSFLRAWELLRDRSIIGGTKVQEASQKAHVDETPKKKKFCSGIGCPRAQGPEPGCIRRTRCRQRTRTGG